LRDTVLTCASLVDHRLQLEQKTKQGCSIGTLVGVQDRVVAVHAAQADTRRRMVRVDPAHHAFGRPVLDPAVRVVVRINERLPAPGYLPIREVAQTERPCTVA
jgi:hypothetical protein